MKAKELSQPLMKDLVAAICPENAIGFIGVDLNALKQNFLYFQKQLTNTEIAPVLKANAYGLGLEQIAAALIEAGAKTFFVANIEEGKQIRKINPNVAIHVLQGLYQNTASEYVKYNITPVLNTYNQALKWNDEAKQRDKVFDCVVHYDIGMSRTGMDFENSVRFINEYKNLKNLKLVCIMGHLSCSEDKENPINTMQLKKFNEFCQHFPNIKQSLSATPALYLDESFKKDVARIGYGLYGFWKETSYDIKPVLHIYTRIIQVRNSKKGDTVGYGAGVTLERNCTLATLSLGYADGYHRFLHNYKPYVYIGNYKAPIIGRISMDFCVVDVTDIPKNEIYEGAFVEVVGSNIRVHDLTDGTDFVPHEIPIHAGKRYYWNYFS